LKSGLRLRVRLGGVEFSFFWEHRNLEEGNGH
jgi:hypothetical protein